MAGLIREFREFAVRGSVIDLAVGIIIGGAFNRIVNSFVEDIIMPPLGLVIARVDFRELAITLGINPVTQEPINWNYGNFLNHVLQFTIVAFAVFILVRAINRLRAKVEPPAPTSQPVTKQCPFCLSDVPTKASRCAHCTSDLPPLEPSPA
jgi:large conductance mechanosensitive channel